MTRDNQADTWVAYMECLDPTTRTPRKFYLAHQGGPWVDDTADATRFDSETAALEELRAAHLGATKAGAEQI